MTTRITYIADDGMEFETEKECFEYEHKHDDIVNSDVKFWDLQRQPLDKADIKNCLEICYAMYIPNEEIAEKVNDAFNYFGIESPWSDSVFNFEIGYFYYENRWISIDKEIASLNEIINSLK